MTLGPIVFARYAYPPNALGYCGPADHAALLGAASEGDDLRELTHLASRFEGAWPYLELIAGCNGVADPLDERVVEAYWVGNRLLDRVPAGALVASLDERFARRTGRDFEPIAMAVPLGGVAHHSFHVFAVYPWLGLLRSGTEGPALAVLDRCRIRWGRVITVEGDTVVVRNRTLEFRGDRLVLGAARTERVRRAVDGVGILGDLRAGEIVSLHWDWVCERLSAGRLAALRRANARNLAVVNALPAPGPVVAANSWGG
ncbi:MAG: DUF6390 family protein [Acidimicrobiales bacterium]